MTFGTTDGAGLAYHGARALCYRATTRNDQGLFRTEQLARWRRRRADLVQINLLRKILAVLYLASSLPFTWGAIQGKLSVANDAGLSVEIDGATA